MLLLALGTFYAVAATGFVGSVFVLSMRRRDDRQRAADDADQMRALRPTRAPLTGGGVFTTRH